MALGCRCFAALGILAASNACVAQCEPQWLAGDGITGVDFTVTAITSWDPDGPGGEPARIVVGGIFANAGTKPAARIAVWDGDSWSPLGVGMNGTVSALAVLQNGELVAGGNFTSAGGVVANRIARWNGSTWTSFGTGMNSGSVNTLAVHPNGDLWAGGTFTAVNGTAANRIARWDGTNWIAMSSGMTGGNLGTSVRSIVFLPNGDAVAAGAFASAGGIPANNIAQWNGTSWTSLGSGTNGTTSACVVLANGELVAGGLFSLPSSNIARWNGSQWLPLGDGLNQSVTSLSLLPNGNMIAGGSFTIAAGNSVGYIAQWNGAAWSPVGSGMSVGLGGTQVNALTTLPDGTLVMGGSCTTASSVPSSYIARFSGQDWMPVGVGMSVGKIVQQVNCVTALPDGGMVAGGDFTHAGRGRAMHIAIWDRRQWKPLDAGMAGGSPTTSVSSLAVLHNGDIVAGGRFSHAGNAMVTNVARWDGSAWMPLGAGLNDTVLSLAVTSNGDLIAGGFFTASGSTELDRVARWDGDSWSPLGSGFSGDSTSVSALAVGPNGEIFAGGTFLFSNGNPVNRIARWDGSTWSPLGDGFPSGSVVSEIAVVSNGDVIVGGDFSTVDGTPASNIARWDGTSWHALGKGLDSSVYCLSPMPDGSVVAGGRFTGSGAVNPVPVSHIARWNGVSWLPMGSGMTGSIQDIRVTTLARLTTGDLAAGGNFLYADGKLSSGVSRWTSDASPQLAAGPDENTIKAGEDLAVHAESVSGYAGVSFKWQRDGVDIANGPGGASVGGGTVSGASGVLDSPTSGGQITLELNGAQISDTGNYSLILTNSCGSTVRSATQIVHDCPADLNNDSVVDDADFVVFVHAYDILDCADGEMTPGCPADQNRDGFVNDADFVLFLAGYNQLICS